MFKSLAGVAPYEFGKGVAINKKMIVWNCNIQTDTPICTTFIAVWNGFVFCQGFTTFDHACEIPAEQDENCFVRDGVKYVADLKSNNPNCSSCDECEAPHNFPLTFDRIERCRILNGVSCIASERKDGKPIRWKRAEPKTRQYTEREILMLDSVFARFKGDEFGYIVSNAYAVSCKDSGICHCPRSEMTDEHPSTWKWRELKTECE